MFGTPGLGKNIQHHNLYIPCSRDIKPQVNLYKYQGFNIGDKR